jgi:hypothetical protein
MKKGKMKVLKRQVCKRKLLQKRLEIEQVHWTSPQREIMVSIWFLQIMKFITE